MQDFIDMRIEDGVAVLTMTDAGSRNALADERQFGGLERACQAVSRDRGIRCVILTGEGPAFCAGGDIKAMKARTEAPELGPIDDRYHYKEGIHRIPLALYELETPVIAAVNGPAIGAGLDLACMCDLRIASTKARFAESFVTLGIIPGDGGAYLLQRIVGLSKAMEMTFTGQTIDAAQALACGLVSRVTEPQALMDEAKTLARQIAANPGHVLRMAKRLVREAQHERLSTVLELSAAFQALAHATPDHRARLGAAVDRLSAPRKEIAP